MFDPKDPREIASRCALAHARELKIPLRLHLEEGNAAPSGSDEFARRVGAANGPACEVRSYPGTDHWSMVAPAIADTIPWFQALAAQPR